MKVAEFFQRLLNLVLVLAAAIYFIKFFYVALLRLNYPFDLEWMEGAMVEHTIRAREGKNIYVTPSLDFIPFIYTPFYYYLTGLLMFLTDNGYLPLRLVSILATSGTFILISVIVKKETDSFLSGFIAAGLFAATYSVTGFWFDLARVDSLFIFLSLCAAYILLYKNSVVPSIFAGALIFLSWFTKQSAIIIFLPILTILGFTDFRKAIYAGATSLILVFCTIFFLNKKTAGWFSFYTEKLPSVHDIISENYSGFWLDDLIGKFPLLCSVFIILLLSSFSLAGKRKSFLLLFSFFTGLILSSYIGRLHSGGDINVLIAATVALCLSAGILLGKKATLPKKLYPVVVVVSLTLIVQFAMLNYRPAEQIPTKADVESGERFIDSLRKFKGEIFTCSHSYISRQAGKKSSAHFMAIFDILNSNLEGQLKRDLYNSISEAIANRKYDAIIMDNDFFIYETIDRYYYRTKKIFNDDFSFYTRTGVKTRPEKIFVPLSDNCLEKMTSLRSQ